MQVKEKRLDRFSTFDLSHSKKAVLKLKAYRLLSIGFWTAPYIPVPCK